MNKLII